MTPPPMQTLDSRPDERLDAGRLRLLRDRLATCDAAEAAALLEALDAPADRAAAFATLPREAAADAFEYLPHDAQAALVADLAGEQERLADLLNTIDPDDRTAFFADLPGPAVQRLLTLLSPRERATAVRLLGYPEESVGRLMTTDYVAVRPDWTAAEALRQVRRYGTDSETIHVLYVVERGWRLVATVGIRDVLLTDGETPVRDVMDERVHALAATDDQEAAVAAFRDADRTSLPVIDESGVLLGIVTVDDVLDVAEAEATEDIQKLGGMEALDEPYLQTPFWTLVRKRTGWLVVLFVGEMLTATAMGFFEAEIARAVVLALFVPLIISSGGNSGSQAASLVIRALAVGEVTVRDAWRLVRRETLTGLVMGTILGAVGALRITIWALAFGAYGPHWALVAATVGISLVGVVLWGTLSGALLPLAMQRLGFDPAASSAPFVATLVDVTGLVIYFTVAAVLLRGTLL
ncbi:MAG TPA: magnesium transporter [Rubricoccaceae bacterium]